MRHLWSHVGAAVRPLLVCEVLEYLLGIRQLPDALFVEEVQPLLLPQRNQMRPLQFKLMSQLQMLRGRSNQAARSYVHVDGCNRIDAARERRVRTSPVLLAASPVGGGGRSPFTSLAFASAVQNAAAAAATPSASNLPSKLCFSACSCAFANCAACASTGRHQDASVAHDVLADAQLSNLARCLARLPAPNWRSMLHFRAARSLAWRCGTAPYNFVKLSVLAQLKQVRTAQETVFNDARSTQPMLFAWSQSAQTCN